MNEDNDKNGKDPTIGWVLFGFWLVCWWQFTEKNGRDWLSDAIFLGGPILIWALYCFLIAPWYDDKK